MSPTTEFFHPFLFFFCFLERFVFFLVTPLFFLTYWQSFFDGPHSPLLLCLTWDLWREEVISPLFFLFLSLRSEPWSKPSFSSSFIFLCDFSDRDGLHIFLLLFFFPPNKATGPPPPPPPPTERKHSFFFFSSQGAAASTERRPDTPLFFFYFKLLSFLFLIHVRLRVFLFLSFFPPYLAATAHPFFFFSFPLESAQLQARPLFPFSQT